MDAAVGGCYTDGGRASPQAQIVAFSREKLLKTLDRQVKVLRTVGCQRGSKRACADTQRCTSCVQHDNFRAWLRKELK